MSEPDERIHQIIESHLSVLRQPRILDAGCGYTDHLGFGPRARIVGIDLSDSALEANTHVHERIIGDVHTHRFERDSFDVVVAWDVLEHLSEPEQAMCNLITALKPGGLMVISVANPFSLKGLVTRLTPHAFHVWAYRRLFGQAHAGRPGFAPFPVYLRASIAPAGLRRFSREQGLAVELLELLEGGQIKTLDRRLPILGLGFRAVAGLLWILSFGRYRGWLTDTLAVLRKPADQASPRNGGGSPVPER